MDIQTGVEIAQLALGLITVLAKGTAPTDAVAAELVRIAVAVNQAHNDLVGAPIDPASLTIELES